MVPNSHPKHAGHRQGNQSGTQADLFETRATQPYPEDYFEMVAQAECAPVAGFEALLTELVSGIDGYTTV